MKHAPAPHKVRRGVEAHARGLWAETLCKWVLRIKGYQIVACRFKTGLGEIDLIAARGRTLALIEVKARPDERAAMEAVSVRQKERLARAASVFLARHPSFRTHDIRFDFMLVLPGRWPRHVPNAFEGQGL